jgi:hypothetical protein
MHALHESFPICPSQLTQARRNYIAEVNNGLFGPDGQILQIKKLGQPEIKQPNPSTRRDQGGAQIDGFEDSHPHRNVCSQIIGEFKLFNALNLTCVHAISVKAAGTQSPAAEPALNAPDASRGLVCRLDLRDALPHLKTVKPAN